MSPRFIEGQIMKMDAELSALGRDQGIAIAEENAGITWNQRATQIALSFFRAAGPEGALFEEARAYAEFLDLPPPASPNAWGAVANWLSRNNLIVKTGVYKKSRSVRSHAREQPVWRVK